MDPIEHLLTHGVDTIYPSREALDKYLRSGKKLTLYQGFDPTGTQLHIGHAVALRKLREFQQLGHTVIFLIGDGTGQAGDPSGKKKSREKFFNREELRNNARDYIMQAGKIVKFDGENPVLVKYNGDWLNALTLVDILNIAQNFSVQQLIERDMFQERLKHNESINLREFLYPLLQGYDSVAMEVDLELGGTDQTFNMMAGRTLVHAMLNKEKFVMTVPLLTDAKGVKIGKSEGNVIGITDPPVDFYGKIMSLGDDAIFACFSLLTDLSSEEMDHIKQALDGGENPMIYKKRLAFELTKQFHTDKDANTAQGAFETTFQQKTASVPNKTVELNKKDWNILDLLIEIHAVPSKSEGRRLVEHGAVELANQVIQKNSLDVTVNTNDILKVGKKQVIQLVVQ